MADGTVTELDHGHVAIASITSCTNTSNPSVMMAAGLLARNAVARGLRSKPWVKTSTAPGSQVVTDYYEKAGLWPALNELGFNVVGYGCATCIGNSGPLPAEVSQAVNDATLLKYTLEPYGIHELVIEDILSRKQRPKIEDYGNYLFIAAQVYHYTAAGKLNSDQVYLIIGKDFVLSFQQKPLGLFSQLRRQMSENPRGILGKNTAFLAYCLLDRIVDDYFIVLEEYNNRVEAIDKSLFKDENSDILGKIDRLKRDAVRLRRTLLPLRDVFYQLAVRGDFAIFKGESTVYLRDVYDHNMQLIESLDASRDMVLSMMDIYLSFQSNRMNQQMRVLTVITIIFMPLTVITGIYGMNFDNMPELHWHYGYFIVLGLMLCIIVGLLIFFSRRKWL
ncbi:MAG: magnesium/cobalt transporter CorA, partial [Neisseria elongata]